MTRAGAATPKHVRLGVAVLSLAMLVVLLPTLPTGASESPPDASGEAAEVRPGSRQLTVDHNLSHTKHVWAWSKGKRAYYLQAYVQGQPATNANAAQIKGFDHIIAVDLEDGTTLGSSPLVVRGYRGPWNAVSGLGKEHLLSVDEEGGRLFVATSGRALDTNTGQAAEASGGAVTGATKGQACLHLGASTSIQCLTGFSVVDATTLEHVRHVPLRGVQVDAPMVAPHLVAMDYSPPFEGLPGKVHMLVADVPHGNAAQDALGGIRYNGRNFHNLIYAVQLDPETGQQDWVVRLDACRGVMAGRSFAEYEVNNYPHQAVVFRSRRADERAVYAGCHNSSQSFTGSVVRIPLDAEGAAKVTTVPRPGSAEDAELPVPALAADVPPRQSSPDFPDLADGRPMAVDGPDRVYQMLADPASGRILMEVLDGRPLAMVWYVFDTAVMQFVGTIGIGGPMGPRQPVSGLDRQNGRLYVLASPNQVDGQTFEGGLFAADIRHTPVPQALHFPVFAPLAPVETEVTSEPPYRYALSVQNLEEGGARLWYPSVLNRSARPAYRSIDDVRAAVESPPPPDFTGRTLDLDEAEGVTSSAVDGVARGFGYRALLVAGAEGAARLGPADPVGLAAQCNDPSWTNEVADPWHSAANYFDTALDAADGHPRTVGQPGLCNRARTPLPTGCVEQTREIVLAFVGPQAPAVVDANGARGAAAPFVIDSATGTDASAPTSRCAQQDWDQIWGKALFGRAPAPEPSVKLDDLQLVAECLSAGEASASRKGDAVTDGYSAAVSCDETETSGHAYARGGGLTGVSVAEAISSFRIYRDPARGIVSRVESVVRGAAVDGVVRIDTVRGVAESWANGRALTEPVLEEGQTYDPNCDFERTAGTCFRRHLFGVWTPHWSCGPCGDEEAFLRGLNAALNPNMTVRLRDPDQRLRQGSENGFAAAIQKPEHERFADLVLNNDLMQTTLATLEIVRPAPPNRPASRQGVRGRQIYQFAGVEVSSSYGIACLLVYDEATNTCAGEKLEPGAIQVSLSDSDGKALAGGAFEVRADVDADGVLGLKDTLLPNGACVTADDGVGTCKFDALQPGTYLVNQVAAPPGYAKSAEPFVVELASGEQRTVAFTNVSNLSTVDIKATDENGAPLSGAVFAAYPDPDSDGKVAPEAKPAAECTTDGQGACSMKVPAGSYVLVQTGAPGGLEGIEPVAFTFASGGQVAAVTVVNYPPGVPEAPAAPASPIYTPPVDVAPPTEIVDDGYVAPTTPVDTVEEPQVSVPERIGGTVTQVIRAPGDALRLLARDPKQAVAWTAALALFVLAAMAVRRRQQASALIEAQS